MDSKIGTGVNEWNQFLKNTKGTGLWNNTTEAKFPYKVMQRQKNMLTENIGYNVSPESWSQYATIGRSGTYITDKKAIIDAVGDFKPGMYYDPKMASNLEYALGLRKGSLNNGFRITEINNITNMMPRSPYRNIGNEYFLGPGKGLPGGGPEIIIEPYSIK